MSFPKLKVLDLRHLYYLVRTPDFSGLPVLEMLILEDCIHLVEFHESIGDLQSLLFLNLRNCKSLVELPEELSRLNSLKTLVLDGCSNLDGLNIELEQLRRRRLLQSDGIVANISDVTSLTLKLFSPSWFSARKISRFTSFSLPSSLVELYLVGTAIRSLPKSIKALSRLRFLTLSNCQVLQTIPELPSKLLLIDVCGCYSLQRVPNLVYAVVQRDCDQLAQVQDLIKQELIEKFDLLMWRITEMVSLQIQSSALKIVLEGSIFTVFLEEREFLRFYKEEDEWVILNEFQELSFKISLPSEHQICGINLFITYFATSALGYKRPVVVKLRNNTKGIGVIFRLKSFPRAWNISREDSVLVHMKCGGHTVEFDRGDEASVSVHTNEPAFQIKKVGVRMLHEEEGNNHNIQSNNEVVTAYNCSASWDNQAFGDGHVEKAHSF